MVEVRGATVILAILTNVKNAECGRIQTFLIQYTIHLSLVALSSCVGVIPQMVLEVVFFVILEKWKVLLAIFKLLKISIFPYVLDFKVQINYFKRFLKNISTIDGKKLA